MKIPPVMALLCLSTPIHTGWLSVFDRKDPVTQQQLKYGALCIAAAGTAATLGWHHYKKQKKNRNTIQNCMIAGCIGAASGSLVYTLYHAEQPIIPPAYLAVPKRVLNNTSLVTALQCTYYACGTYSAYRTARATGKPDGKSAVPQPIVSSLTFQDCQGIKIPECIRTINRFATDAPFRKGLQELNKNNDPRQLLYRGVLLHGQPGVGKTRLAKALAGNANIPLFALDKQDLSAYHAESAQYIAKTFKTAARYAKDNTDHGLALVFMDEFESIAPSRRKVKAESGEAESTTELLKHIGTHPGVITIAATNHLRKIDSAILREGRFDEIVEIEKPQADGVAEIINYCLEQYRLDPALQHSDRTDLITTIQRSMQDTTPAAIDALLRKALLHAGTQGHGYLTASDIGYALQHKTQ